MASGAPGGNFRGWTPTPPERGSFPLDHDHECSKQMQDYLKCMKYTDNRNAPNCRILAKSYLKCRMDNQLMEQSDWASLGLINLPGDKTPNPANNAETTLSSQSQSTLLNSNHLPASSPSAPSSSSSSSS